MWAKLLAIIFEKLLRKVSWGIQCISYKKWDSQSGTISVKFDFLKPHDQFKLWVQIHKRADLYAQLHKEILNFLFLLLFIFLLLCLPLLITKAKLSIVPFDTKVQVECRLQLVQSSLRIWRLTKTHKDDVSSKAPHGWAVVANSVLSTPWGWTEAPVSRRDQWLQNVSKFLCFLLLCYSTPVSCYWLAFERTLALFILFWEVQSEYVFPPFLKISTREEFSLLMV